MRGAVVASPNVTSPSVLAAPARTNGRFETKCISVRSSHLQSFKPLVSAFPAVDDTRPLPHSNARLPDSTTCAAGTSATMSASGQTQTLPRGNTATKAPVQDKVMMPRLDDGGFAKERLHLFKAELLEEGSFNAAVAGCVGVFHTASPVSNLAPSDPQAELIDPALKGTLNVLRSCSRVSSIKRVILTSSVAAVPYTRRPLTPDLVVDETWFTDPEAATEKKLWYQVSKTLAEKAAWKFAEENNIDLVVINPGLVIGPLLQPALNSSVEYILKLVNGAQTYPQIHLKLVDVRDVALAHVLTFEIPSASGRYLLVARGEYVSEVAKILRLLYPTLSLPEKFNEVETTFVKYGVSQEKFKTLGIDFIPLEVSLKDTIESFIEKGFLSF